LAPPPPQAGLRHAGPQEAAARKTAISKQMRADEDIEST
jgi:hypothetical protein